MTLVEVIGGLALLATLLVALLAARDRHTRQWTRAQERLQATAAADALLAGWWAGKPDAFPRRGAGEVPGGGGLAWRTSVVPEPTVNALGGEVVRLEVFDARAAGPDALRASVDVVLAAPLSTSNAP